MNYNNEWRKIVFASFFLLHEIWICGLKYSERSLFETLEERYLPMHSDIL
jgi:hypothetical protein